MIGIYKVTNPSKKIYIGQSIDIEKRFSHYKRLNNCKSQRILYRSFLKYGANNHKFQIIEECKIDELNDKERYYQDLYCVLNKNGLNCVLTKSSDRSGNFSDETKRKISERALKMSEETKAKMSEVAKLRTFSKATRLKMGASRKGKKHSESTKLKLSLTSIGNKNFLGKKHSKQSKLNMALNNCNSKIVLDTQSGIFYNSAKEVSITFNLVYSTLKCRLNGSLKNKTNFIYV